MSVTKLFTASLVLRAADRGLIDLDAPLPALGALPEFAPGALMTPLMLLTHRSGLVNYRDSTAYLADPLAIDSPTAAVHAAAAQALTMTPGERVEYSSTNFLVLGLLLEQVTGRDFTELFQRGVLGRFGLTESRHAGSEPGEPRGATAGMVAPMRDLVRAAATVLTGGDGVSPQLHRLRAEPDADSAAGAGSYGYCPCYEQADGTKTFFGVGYTGGHTWVAHVPSLGVTVGVDVYDTLWSDGRYGAVNELIVELAHAAARVPV
jgi:CubicO group peptidase (beta-lactamase class C family)